MTKVICDKCGKDISGRWDDPIYKIEINEVYQDNSFTYELCAKCREELAKFLNDEEGLKHD